MLKAALQCGTLFAMRRRCSAVGPGDGLRPIIRTVDHDSVIAQTYVVDLFQERAHELIVFQHAVGIEPNASFALA